MDIEFGSYKLKINSSDGGHNGIKSIINRLGSNGTIAGEYYKLIY